MPPSTLRVSATGARRSLALGGVLHKTHQTLARSYQQVHRARTKELTDVNVQAAKLIQPPSTVRYSLFIGLSLYVDIVLSPLVIAAWTTVVLGILATIALAIVMAVLGRLFLGSQGKKAAKHRKEIEGLARQLERDTQLVQQEYRSFLLWVNTVGTRFPRLAARATTTAARAGRVAGKYRVVRYAGKTVNWLKKGWFKQASEAIPGWNAFPWWTIGAVAAYLSHRGDYKEAQSILAQYNEGKINNLNMTDSMYETRLSVVGSLFSGTMKSAAYLARSRTPETIPTA